MLVRHPAEQPSWMKCCQRKVASLENSPAIPANERMRFRSDATPKRATPKRSRLVCGLTLLCTLPLFVAQIPSTHADSASCLAKVSSYVAELDELFGREEAGHVPLPIHRS